jgi:signal transduction histidine kinase
MDPGALSWTRRYEVDPAVPEEGSDDETCREFLRLYRGQVAFGLTGRDRLMGVLVLGPTLSDRPFRADERSFLGALAGQLASVVETSALHGRVAHADRLSTLGTLAASLAHELRNPLASISMFVQMLPQRAADADFMVKFNRIVPAELGKLTGMTDQLLNLARPATRAPRVVDLGALCLRLQQLVGHQFRKHQVRLAFDTPEGVLVHGVEEELSQVLLNLLLNAQEVSPAQGQVQVSLEGRFGWAELMVEDQGPGLTPPQLARVFQPFYTTKELGHGLGLATSRSLIRGLGGELLAANRDGGGARFTVRLPLAGAMRPNGEGS